MNAETLCGKVLGSCTLQQVIGRGSMGAVYLARQSRPNRQVAVKVLLPTAPIQSSRHTAFLERFRHETDAAALLQHPNIMPVHEYGEIDGLAYLVMPYISGGTLQDELNTQGKLPLTRVVFYLEQIAAAIDFAHEHGVIHRDIKPANIMLTPEKRILLTDFGMVRIVSEQQNSPSDADIPISTHDYMAPEQIAGGPIDTRTDTYSLSIILYQMVTGTLPYKKRSTIPPTSPCMLRPDLPEAAEAVILHAITLKPAARFTHARAMAREFRSQLEKAGVQVDTTYHIAAREAHPSNNQPRTRSLLDPLWRTDTASVAAITSTGASGAIENNFSGPSTRSTDATASAVQKGKSTGNMAKYGANVDSFIDTAGHVNASAPIHTDKQATAPSSQQYLPTTTKERNRLSVKDMYNQSKPTHQDYPAQDQPVPTRQPTNNLLLPSHSRQNRKTSLYGWQSEKIPAVPASPADDRMQPAPPATPDFLTHDPFHISATTPNADTQQMPQDGAPPLLPKRASLNVSSRTRQLGSSSAEEPTQSFNQSQFSPMTQPAGNITRQLTNTTGMLPAPGSTGMLPAPGSTGALIYPPGEYSGDTGMLRLNQPVKVVKVPVAGQPGQYMTGILPVQPRTNALPPLNGQNGAEQNSSRKYSKIILLAILALVLIAGSGGFLLLHQHAQQQTTTNTAIAKQIQSHNATATAVANAQATAAINNIILEDPLATNIHGWPVVMNDHGRSYFFKNGAYHIRQDGTFLAYAYMANEVPPTNFAYSLTMQQISGDNTVDFNYYGPILRYNNDNGHVTFYMFKIINNKAQTKYQFLSYDSKNAANPWSNSIWQKNTGKEFRGAKKANTVKIVINKNTFTFYVNGTRLGQAQSTLLTTGNVGMGVSHQGNETAFTNLLLTHQ
jgi:serine/threonine protein kinase